MAFDHKEPLAKVDSHVMALLNIHFDQIWVKGERVITNFSGKKPAAIYFFRRSLCPKVKFKTAFDQGKPLAKDDHLVMALLNIHFDEICVSSDKLLGKKTGRSDLLLLTVTPSNGQIFKTAFDHRKP